MTVSAELIELSVERIGVDGDGIAKWRCKPVYLPFTVPGDHVRAVLGARRGGGYEGRVVELLMPGDGLGSVSRARATPDNPAKSDSASVFATNSSISPNAWCWNRHCWRWSTS